MFAVDFQEHASPSSEEMAISEYVNTLIPGCQSDRKKKANDIYLNILRYSVQKTKNGIHVQFLLETRLGGLGLV